MIIEALAPKLLERARRGTFTPRVSRAGTCPRALAYHALGIPESDPTPARIGMVFLHGNTLEEAVLEALRDAGLDLHSFQRPVRIPYRYGFITGHVDALLGATHVVDLKSINTYGFDDVLKGGPLREHLIQVLLYIHGLRREGEPYREGLLLYVDKNSGRVAECLFSVDSTEGRIVRMGERGPVPEEIPFVYPNPRSLIAEGIRVFEAVEEHRRRTLERVPDPARSPDYLLDLPPRPYRSPEQAPCSYCTWRSRCWALYPYTPSRPKAADLSHLALVFDRYFELMERKERIEQELEEIRATIRTALSDAGARTGTAPGAVAELVTTVRRRLNPAKLSPEEIERATEMLETVQLTIRRQGGERWRMSGN